MRCIPILFSRLENIWMYSIDSKQSLYRRIHALPPSDDITINGIDSRLKHVDVDVAFSQ